VKWSFFFVNFSECEAMKASRQYTQEKAAETKTDDYKPRQKLHQRTNQKAQKSYTNTWKK